MTGKSKANLDQSLYAKKKSQATQRLSAELGKLYHNGGEALDQGGAYGSQTTLRAKMDWLRSKGLLSQNRHDEIIAENDG